MTAGRVSVRKDTRKDTRFAIHVAAGDRLFIAGMNGTGKSLWATAVGSRWDRVLVYDPKVDPNAELPNATVAYGVKRALAALPGRVIYRPTRAEMTNPGQFFGQLCDTVYEAGGHGIVIHEAADFGSTDRELAPGIARVVRAGRSRQVPIACVTQRPVNVARIFKSEASHFVSFFLVDPDDRKTMAGFMGPEVAENPVRHDFSYWYRGPDLVLRHMPPLAIR